VIDPTDVLHVRGPALLIAVGPAAAGKSTVLRRLAALGVVDTVVSTDAVRAELGLDPAETEHTYTVAHHRAAAALHAGLVVAFDATNVRPADRRPLCDLAATTGADAVAVRVGTGLSMAELAARDASRARHVPVAVLASKREEFTTLAGRDVLAAEPFAAVVDAESTRFVRCAAGCGHPGVTLRPAATLIPA
jgi:predicted kinase